MDVKHLTHLSTKKQSRFRTIYIYKIVNSYNLKIIPDDSQKCYYYLIYHWQTVKTVIVISRRLSTCCSFMTWTQMHLAAHFRNCMASHLKRCNFQVSEAPCPYIQYLESYSCTHKTPHILDVLNAKFHPSTSRIQCAYCKNPYKEVPTVCGSRAYYTSCMSTYNLHIVHFSDWIIHAFWSHISKPKKVSCT